MLDYTQIYSDNKYTRVYIQIISRAQKQARKRLGKSHPDYAYYELHHILPKSIYPEYKDVYQNKWNVVLLTAREHYVCHLLLTKMNLSHDHNNSMKQAFYMMASYGGKLKSNKLYQNIRISLSDALSKRVKGVPKSAEQNAKMVATKIRNGTIKHTAEARARMRIAQKGKIITAEDRAKKSKSLTGRTLSPEHKANLSLAKKGKQAWNKGQRGRKLVITPSGKRQYIMPESKKDAVAY